MPRPTCYTSSSIGPCPTLGDNFADRPETYSITWDDGFNFDDPSFFKVFHQCEPPEVMDITSKLIVNRKYYDLILAWDERVLSECPNSKFLTESACSWLPRSTGNPGDVYGTMNYEGMLHKNPVAPAYVGCDVAAKKFEVSFLTSSKRAFPGHILRQEIFDKLPTQVGSIFTWKHRSPPIVNDKRTILEPYMFSIVPENSRHNGYYTEKIIDCFVAKTIPVYWGCPNLSKYFNMDGVIMFDNYEDLINKLSVLTPENYTRISAAIEDNFNRALQGVHQWNLIENYITEGIRNKYANPVAEEVKIVYPNRRPIRRP